MIIYSKWIAAYLNSREHFPDFKANCQKFQSMMKKGGNPQVTVFMDWSDDDINKLEDTCMQYSGMVSLYDPIEINNNEYSLPIEYYDSDSESLKKASRVDSSRFLSLGYFCYWSCS